MTGVSGGRRGVVLVAVLFLSVSLLLMAMATATLATLHLQAARYAERAQRARIAARSGVELALATLEARFHEEGTLPERPPSLPDGHGLELRIVGYRRTDARHAEIEVEGRDHGATAVAGARLSVP